MMEVFIKPSQGKFFLYWILLLWPNHGFADPHASASILSNYISRGYSKSQDHFAYRIDVDYQHSLGFYAGASTATVNFGDSRFNDSARFEIAPYLGWSFELNEDWRLDSQYSRYFFDGKIFGADADYNEFYLFLHFQDLLSLSATFSEDYYRRDHSAGFFEITGRYPITDFLEFSAGTGYSLTRKSLDNDYLYWNAGITAFYKMISLDLRYAEAAITHARQSHSLNEPEEFYPSALPTTLLFSVTIGY